MTGRSGWGIAGDSTAVRGRGETGSAGEPVFDGGTARFLQLTTAGLTTGIGRVRSSTVMLSGCR